MAPVVVLARVSKTRQLNPVVDVEVTSAETKLPPLSLIVRYTLGVEPKAVGKVTVPVTLVFAEKVAVKPPDSSVTAEPPFEMTGPLLLTVREPTAALPATDAVAQDMEPPVLNAPAVIVC